ncbi:MAG: hypothetical protein ABFS23_09525 [Pseudomonadota bacterium]
MKSNPHNAAATARVLFVLIAALAANVCTAGDLLGHGPSPKDQIKDPKPEIFSICFQHTCAEIDHVSLSEEEWRQVRDHFSPPSEDAAQERQRIGSAIAYLEVAVGRQVDTLGDRGGNLKGFLASGNQMDCIDESTNSTTYLKMMAGDGLLRFHKVEKTSTRGFMIMGWPHTTAVVRDTTTGEKWAVDSWFLDNGVPPAIVPLSQWRSGWRPKS